MSVTLDDVTDQLDRNTRDIAALHHAHNPAALTQRPGSTAWSACECIEHLRLTTSQYLPRMQNLLQRLQQRNLRSDDTTIRPGWFAAWFIRQAGPDNSRRLPAPRPFRPAPGDVGPNVFDAFNDSQQHIADTIAAARGYDLNSLKLPTPVTSLVRFTLGEAFLLIARHQQRHLQQAQRAAAASPSRT